MVGAALALRKIFQIARFGAGLFGSAGTGGIAAGAGGAVGGALGGLPLPLPVFVVNRQMSLLPGASGGAPTLPGDVATTPTRAARLAALAKGAAGVSLAGAAGYAVGTGIYKTTLEQGNVVADVIGASIGRLMALFGSQAAQEAIEQNRLARQNEAGFSGHLTVQIDDRGTRVTGMQANGDVELDVSTGPLSFGAPP